MVKELRCAWGLAVTTAVGWCAAFIAMDGDHLVY
jgi:hypothetical protein